MTNIFITEKTKRLLRIMVTDGPLAAQSSARASSMLRAAELLGRHQQLGGVETDANMHSMLVLLDIAQQCQSRTEAGKITYFNTNWEKVAPFWHDGYHAQETFVRELGLPHWVQIKVNDGTWDPSGSRAHDVRGTQESVVAKKATTQQRTTVDAKLGIDKIVCGSVTYYEWRHAPAGVQANYPYLKDAKMAIEAGLQRSLETVAVNS